MKRFLILITAICIFITFFTTSIFAVRPFITSLYLADPSGHDFEGRLYVYPSHDKDEAGWFDMEDYHVFSSADLLNWVDHGVVLSYKDVDWVDKTLPRFWAPDCAYRDGTYYFYYPARDKNVYDDYAMDSFKIGVAKSISPSGPFVPVKYEGDTEEKYIPGSYSIDPCVFIDETDGQAYMIFGGKDFGGLPYDGPMFVKLKANMMEFDGVPQIISIKDQYGNPVYDWFEGSWIHQRRNDAGQIIYYLSYCTGYLDENGSRIHYATNTDITDNDGWLSKGEVIPYGSGKSIQQSFVKFKDDWFVLFHTSDLSGGIREKRNICIAKAQHLSNGDIKKVDMINDSLSTIGAYSRIKAMFFSGQSGIETSEDSGGGDIGKCVCYIEQGDYIYFDSVDFGKTGANGFEAQVASANEGGKIEIRLGSSTGTLIGTATVSNTGDWHKWANVSCNISPRVYGIKKIYLVFTGSGYLFNVNWFTFKSGIAAPIGYSAAFKSLNPNCIDYEGNQGQKYLCVDNNNNQDLCANRSGAGGALEKFSILNGRYNRVNLIRINSSNNGKNLRIMGSEKPINASGGNYKEFYNEENFFWTANDDGTISLQNFISQKYLCVDTFYYGNDPAKVYDNKTAIDTWEKFYCETADAPIGYVVAFKSLNTRVVEQYLCIDGSNNNDICANKPAVNGDWGKFLVVDANNGYIALKSLNGNKYLRFVNENTPGNANGDTIDENAKFQWKNNGDGTMSLKAAILEIEREGVKFHPYLCVDTDLGSPAKVYANRTEVGEWEKFYCQIIK